MIKKNKPIIFFSHGKESGPQGTKIKYLSKIATENGYKVESIDYRNTQDPDERVQILIDSIRKHNQDIILYGSSMGAYVSLVVSEIIKPKGLFLCAPALFINNYKVQTFNQLNCPITIIQGRKDSVVNPLTTIEFAEKYKYDLYLVNDDHSLSSSEEIISINFENFIKKL